MFHVKLCLADLGFHAKESRTARKAIAFRAVWKSKRRFVCLTSQAIAVRRICYSSAEELSTASTVSAASGFSASSSSFSSEDEVAMAEILSLLATFII